jgi:hypothetical protein
MVTMHRSLEEASVVVLFLQHNLPHSGSLPTAGCIMVVQILLNCASSPVLPGFYAVFSLPSGAASPVSTCFPSGQSKKVHVVAA